MIQKKKLVQSIKALSKAIDTIEKTDKVKEIVKEIPIGSLSFLEDEGLLKFKAVYSQMRLSGIVKENAYKSTLQLVSRSFKEKRNILKSIQNTLEKIAKVKNYNG
jgi:hypothetical protein